MPEQNKNLVDLNKYLGLTATKAQNRDVRRLKFQDRQIILMALEGHSTQEIVEQLQTSSSHTKRILQSDLAIQVFDDFLSFKDREFQLLYNLAINAVRNALRSEDPDVALRAAEKYLKAHNKFGGGSAVAHDTAEDVIRRIMEIKITEEVPVSKGLEVLD